MLVPHWLEQRASLTPNRTAMICKGEQLSFAQLRRRSRDMACKLATLGVAQGTSVALLCANGLHVPVLIHAVHYLGAMLVPLNTRLSARELDFQLRDAKCTLLIHDEEFLHTVQDIQNQLHDIMSATINDLAEVERADVMLCEDIDMNTVNTIMYTSGTTGAPKGVMLTYGNHWSSAIGSALNLGLSEQDCWLASVPLFHISGLSIVMRSVIYGIPMVIHEKFDPQAANDSIMKLGVTIVSVVSHMLSRMMEALGDRSYPPSFRCMLLGGGPAPLPLLQQCVDKHIPVFQTYGMTETASQIATLQPEYMLTKLGSAGKPLFQAELRIMKEGRPLGRCEAGEIVVRGLNVTSGYWNRPEASAHAIRDGWLFTGDVGYLDEEGFLYVLDRGTDMFISGGENVYPAEIEAVLIGHPHILEAGVIGVEDDRWGKIPVAFVCPKSGADITGQEVAIYCKDKLAKYKIPSRIYFVDRLPRNASNKLLRRELKTLIP